MRTKSFPSNMYGQLALNTFGVYNPFYLCVLQNPHADNTVQSVLRLVVPPGTWQKQMQSSLEDCTLNPDLKEFLQIKFQGILTYNGNTRHTKNHHEQQSNQQRQMLKIKNTK